MEYIAVESSQIAAVGFGDGLYGPETLGIKFPPNKKQPEGAEYHYGNVSARMHLALVSAESVGSYFGKNIEPFPDQYPFTKVEDAISETLPLTTPVLVAEPVPVTALAVIDNMADELLFTPGAVTDAQLAAGRQWYLEEAKQYGIETEEKRSALKRFARPLQKLRTGIEARAKELTGATKRKIATIDAEKRRLVQIVGGIEDEVLRRLTEWEQEEESRKARLSGQVAELALWGQSYYPDIASVEKVIAELKSFDISTMQEYKVGAESAIAASLRVLKPELERRKQQEKDAAELAELRRLQAEREEADRQAAEEARIAAAAKKLADEQIAAAVAAMVAQQEYAEVEKKAEAKKRRDMVHREIIAGLRGFVCEVDAGEIVQAIAKGLIPHLTISY